MTTAGCERDTAVGWTICDGALSAVLSNSGSGAGAITSSGRLTWISSGAVIWPEVSDWRPEVTRGADSEVEAPMLAVDGDAASDLDERRVAFTDCDVEVFDPPDDEPRSPVSALALAHAMQNPAAHAVPIPRATARVPVRPT